jgi:hypothetical protein
MQVGLDVVQRDALQLHRRKARQKERGRKGRARQLVRNTRLGFVEAVLFQPLGQVVIGRIGAL